MALPPEALAKGGRVDSSLTNNNKKSIKTRIEKLRFYDFSNCVFSYTPCAPIVHVNFVSVRHINVPGAVAHPFATFREN